MNVKSISSSTFQNQHQYYLHPAVCDVWNQFHNRYLRHALQRGQPLTLCGDGRTDTSGHSAKFGSYGILDLDQMMVVNYWRVHVHLLRNGKHFRNVYKKGKKEKKAFSFTHHSFSKHFSRNPLSL